jgi:hypothetical protein
MCGRQCDQSRLFDEEFEGKPFLIEGLVEQRDVGESLSQLLGLFAPAAEQGLDGGGRMLGCQARLRFAAASRRPCPICRRRSGVAQVH